MKTLFESILDIDDLDDNVEKSAAELALNAITVNAYTKLSGTVSGNTLQIITNRYSIIIYRIDTDALNKLGITHIHFKSCSPIFHCYLENILISSDAEIHFGRALWSKPMSNVKFEAPFVQGTYNMMNPNYKNVEIVAPFTSIIADPTPGIKKLSRAGFGKFTKTKFAVTDCDQYIMDKATKNVTLKDILPEGINVSTKFISIAADTRRGTIGGYFIADPKYRWDLENDSVISEPIGTLKDGWLITQINKDPDYLRIIFN